jgi:cytoskeletal protein CcmA (bactofilin family)
MQQLHGKYDGGFLLSEDAELHGMVVGNLTVPSGIYLILRGLVTGDLVAQKGAQVVVRGMVTGMVHNDSADVVVFGMVGAVHDSGSTKAKISEGAIIKGSN